MKNISHSIIIFYLAITLNFSVFTCVKPTDNKIDNKKTKISTDRTTHAAFIGPNIGFIGTFKTNLYKIIVTTIASLYKLYRIKDKKTCSKNFVQKITKKCTEDNK